KNEEGVKVSAQQDGACIFLNRPGFARGSGCALHSAALAHGERPMDWKPDVCWQLPLRREDQSDSAGHVTSIVTQWDRRHWGDGGAEFAWWCTEAPEAFTGTVAVYESMVDEQLFIRLLEGTRFLEAPMTTLFHDRAPRLRWVNPASLPAFGCFGGVA